MLGPSVRTCHFLIQPDTGLSLFTLNLCCRLFAMIRTSYTTGTIALLWHGSTPKDVTKELPGGMCSLEFSRWEAWQKYLQWKNHDKFTGFFPPLAILCSILATPFYPLFFPGPGESHFPVRPALFLCLNQLLSGNRCLLLARQLFLSLAVSSF